MEVAQRRAAGLIPTLIGVKLVGSSESWLRRTAYARYWRVR
jgi:hypothetical protein